MKRTTTVILFLIVSSFAAYAQNDPTQTLPWCEDFDNGNAPGWQFIDNDGDGMNWSVSDYEPYNGAFSLFGPSYTNHTEDNWAISPAIEIPQNNQEITLTWKVYSHNSYSERYEVKISTRGSDNLNEYDSLFAETLSGGYYERKLNLSAYAGSTVHVAFRHRSTFQNYLCIDNVCITEKLSIPQVSASDIFIFPNPTSGLLRIEANGLDRVDVLNQTGAVVSTGTNETIDLSPLSSGIYIIRITTQSGATIKKIMKE